MRTRTWVLVSAGVVAASGCADGNGGEGMGVAAFSVALSDGGMDAAGTDAGAVAAPVDAGRDSGPTELVIARVRNPPLPSDLNNLPGDLRGVTVPAPTNLSDFVADTSAAIRLGKALFWDMQIGSDGVQACASCHYRAGADPRSKNQVSPGLKVVPTADLLFTMGGPNRQLRATDFPLTRLAVPGVRGALDPATDSNDVVSSQGVPYLLAGADPLGFQLPTSTLAGAPKAKVRRVEPRNTPSVINAVFNHRQFWDGRAESVFNGVNHLGTRDPNAKVMRVDSKDVVVPVAVAFANGSLASQSVAPIVSDLEMSVPGRTPQEIARNLARAPRQVGRKTVTLHPLDKQRVDRTDSVLGTISKAPAAGVTVPTYERMIQDAFLPKWWDSKLLVQVAADGTVTMVKKPDDDVTTDEFSVMQYNFALFFGLAVQMYESTLVSDNSPWDQFRREHPTATDPALNPWTNTAPAPLSRLALFGAHLFNDRTRGSLNVRCSNCHEQAELTDASVRRIAAATNGPVRNRDGNVIDKGFNNLGIRPTSDDVGVGASDAFGPLSHSRRLFPDALPASFDGAVVSKGFGVDGAFKIPSLRNVALTAPYFHNGDVRTLREAVEFYGRGGNVNPITARDGTLIEPLGVPNLTSDEVSALVAFLEALTDDRVVYRRAPFDHPQLFVPNGHPGDEHVVVDSNGDGFADDVLVEIPAVGAAGGAPLPGFLEGVAP